MKKNKPAEEPVLAEPELRTAAPNASADESLAVPSPDASRIEFVEPGRPTVLAKCSAKEELLERRRAKLAVTDYAHLSIEDIVSGYVNQVHNSRDLEIDMVKQIQQKSEVQLSFLLHSYTYHASPQVYYLW